MAFIENGNDTAGFANVNSDFELPVALSKNINKAGYSLMASAIDLGAITGSPLYRSPRTSKDDRLAVSLSTLLDSDSFIYTAQFSGKYAFSGVTQTAAYTSSNLVLNSGNSVATNTGAFYRTWDFHTLPSEGSLIHEHFVQLSAVGATNTEMYIGRFIGAPTAVPTDGVYCKITGAGVFLVSNNNGTMNEVTPAIQFTPNVNTVFKIGIVENNRYAELWINDVLYCTVTPPIGQVNLCTYPSNPIAWQIRNTAVAPSVANQLKIGNWALWQEGSLSNKPYQLINALRGGVGQGQSGNTQGSIARITNSANQTAAVPTNTTAALGSGLGGEFWETDSLAVTTDGIICSYQNLPPTVALGAKKLLIHGITIYSIVQTALTGGGYNAIWGVAWGHTVLSLATAESSLAKAPRRKVIGTNTVASALAVTTQLTPITIKFENPLVVLAGEYIAIVKKKVGTAPTAGVIAHYIDIDHVSIE